MKADERKMIEMLAAEAERLRKIEAAAINWREAAKVAFAFRMKNPESDPVRVMAPVGRALDKLAKTLEEK